MGENNGDYEKYDHSKVISNQIELYIAILDDHGLYSSEESKDAA